MERTPQHTATDRARIVIDSAQIIGRAYLKLIQRTPRESALAAYTAGGPSVDELERMIIEWRAAHV